MTTPHCPEAERAIFASIFIEPKSFVAIADKLKPKDFFDLTSQDIWSAMSRLYRRGVDIDIVSLRGELKLMEVDFIPALELINEGHVLSASRGNIEEFISEVKNASLLRQINALLQQSGGVVDVGTDARKILADLESGILDISDNIEEKRAVDSEGILEEVNKEIEKNRSGDWRGFLTGFNALDKRTGGILPTHVWIFGAYTGTGKTLVALNMILNLLANEAKVCLFSTEMDRKMNMLRLMGIEAGYGALDIYRGKLTEAENINLEVAVKKLKGYKDSLTIFDNVYTVEEIRLKAKQLQLKKGLDIIVVDFIQNLKGEGAIYENMSTAAIELQKLAQELGVGILVLSQVSQAAAGWSSKKAIEFKGAGEIAAVADVALWMSLDDDVAEGRKIMLRKVRHGAPGMFRIRLSFPSGKAIELDGGGVQVDNRPHQTKMKEIVDVFENP